MGVKLSRPSLDVGLVTADGISALRFWRDLLGLPEAGEVAFAGLGVVKRLAVGDSILRILVLDKPPPHRASVDGFAAQTGLRYVTLNVANLHEVAEQAVAGGYPVPVPPREIRPGVWACQISDGQGTTVELMQQEG
jgi:hypothetical protein